MRKEDSTGTGCKSRSTLTSRQRGPNQSANFKDQRCRMWTHEFPLAQPPWLQARRVHCRRPSKHNTCTRGGPPQILTSTSDREEAIHNKPVHQTRTPCSSRRMTRTVSISQRYQTKTWRRPIKEQLRMSLNLLKHRKRPILSWL